MVREAHALNILPEADRRSRVKWPRTQNELREHWDLRQCAHQSWVVDIYLPPNIRVYFLLHGNRIGADGDDKDVNFSDQTICLRPPD
jgi:hypothetical protein